MKIKIKQMPDKHTLEAFLKGMYGDLKVVFNQKKGRFEWLQKEKSQ